MLVISPDGREGSATIHQDADIYRIRLKPGQMVTHKLRPGRGAWLQIAEGVLSFKGVEVTTGDGASTEELGALTLTATLALIVLICGGGKASLDLVTQRELTASDAKP